jgi:hypothetical protein
MATTDPIPDPTMARLGEAIALSQGGDRTGARLLFAQVWEDVGPDGDPLHQLTLAHHMADVQDDPADELLWDLRALAAADGVTDEQAAAAGSASPVAAFYPSLHLNLGDVYLRLGELDDAQEHLRLGLAAVDELPDDGYGQLIRGGLERLAERLA